MTKLSLTRRDRKQLGKIKNVDYKYKSLTAKEIKYYKPLVEDKLEKMGVSKDTVLAATNKKRKMFHLVDGKPKAVMVPINRLSNFQKNLTKKLMKLSAPDVERFLQQAFNQAETNEVQIKAPENAPDT